MVGATKNGTVFTNYCDHTMNSCILNMSHFPNLIAIRLCVDNEIVVLRAVNDVDMADSDILLPKWAMQVLSLTDGDSCRYTIVEEDSVLVADGCCVKLLFCFSKRICQWDESGMCLSQLEIHNGWQITWPDIDTGALTTLAPSLLNNACLAEGAVVAMKAMDTLLLFKIIEMSETHAGRVQKCVPNTQFDIMRPALHEPISVDRAPAVAAADQGTPPHVCFPLLREKVTVLCDAVFCSGEASLRSVAVPQRLKTRSILISGPDGAGKSHFLSSMAEQFQASADDVLAVVVSCRSISKSLAPSATKRAADLALQLSGDANPGGEPRSSQLIAHVQVLLELLQADPTVRGATVDRLAAGLPVFLLLDDLDPLLLQYGGGGGGGSGEGDSVAGAAHNIDPGNEWQILGCVLSAALRALESSGVGGSVRLFVVGACRLDVKAVPRAHTGCPEFGLVATVPRLAASDRAELLLRMLASLLRELGNVKLETLLPVSAAEDTAGDSVECWAGRLAAITAGYLPGDLIALVQHVGLIHKGRAQASLRSSELQTGVDCESPPQLAWDSVLQALLSLPPKQLQSLGIESSSGAGGGSQPQQRRLSWADFAGYDSVKRVLKRLLRTPPTLGSPLPGNTTLTAAAPSEGAPRPLSLADMFACPRGIILHGPSGCGKSLLARVIAAESNMNFVSVRSTEILSQYFGQTESAVRTLFQRARSAAPCVLFFDEFDAIAYKRGGGGEDGNGLHGRILSTFLNELDGVVGTRSPSGAGAFESSVLVLAACSDVAAIDEALLRPGRLQHHILLDKPSLGDVECIIRRAVERIPCAGDVDVARLGAVLVTCRPSCADAEALCQRALSLAIREEIAILEAGDTAEGRPDGGRQVRMEHFLSALSELTGFSEAHIAALEKQRATPFEWSGNFH